MSIFRRAADVFTAGLHDVVDRFEDPERMLRHSVRQMEELQSITTAAVARSIAAEKILEKSRAQHLAQAETWKQRATTAIAAGDEVLARLALGKKLDHQRAADNLNQQLADARAANSLLRNQLEVLRDKQATARTKLAILSTQQLAVAAQRQAITRTIGLSGREKAFAHFERCCEQIEFAQSEAIALIELETDDESVLESRFDRQETELAIDEELAKLKADRATDQ